MAIHRTREELERGLRKVLQSPKDGGRLEAIVVRPGAKQRRSLGECELSPEGGLHGDRWADGCWKTLPDGRPHPDVQVAIMNSRAIAWIAGDRSRWELAGDSLYVDLDLSDENLSPGDRLSVGSVILVITETPHLGCQTFGERFGAEAVSFVNCPEGRRLHLRGIYARIIQAGLVTVGDVVRKLP